MVRLNFEAVNYDPAPLFASKNKKRQSLLLYLSAIAAFALLTKLKSTSRQKLAYPSTLVILTVISPPGVLMVT